MLERPRSGVSYPGSLPEVRRWFASEADCVDYLDWLRWPEGWSCPSCGSTLEQAAPPGVHRCARCRRRSTVTAGTIFQKTRTPLTVWFEAAWLFTASKQGVSATELQAVTGLGGYQTAWAMLHRFRIAMSSTGRDRLTGRIEVDETYIGGADQPGGFGRSGIGKVLVGAAVERRGPHALGRVRLQVLENGTLDSIRPFLADAVAPGATVISDAFPTYRPATAGLDLRHEPINIAASTRPADELLPGVHRVFSLLKRVLGSTYQGAVSPEHLPAYLDEFAFRFNRRTASRRGLLFLRLLEHAVTAPPTTYRDLVVTPAPTGRSNPRVGPRALPRSLTGPDAQRPWRAA